MLKPKLIALLCLACIQASAQKLSNVQKSGFRAPANIKIDGKTDDWANSFKAYNANIESYYTIANDDDNLYLVIQAGNNDVANKMMRGGITFNINQDKSKDDSSPALD